MLGVSSHRSRCLRRSYLSILPGVGSNVLAKRLKMASGPPVMGCGRGGRGKSLKELLDQPVRKPGETLSEPQEQHSSPKEEATTPTSTSQGAPSPPRAVVRVGKGLTEALLAIHISTLPSVGSPQRGAKSVVSARRAAMLQKL